MYHRIYASCIWTLGLSGINLYDKCRRKYSIHESYGTLQVLQFTTHRHWPASFQDTYSISTHVHVYILYTSIHIKIMMHTYASLANSCIFKLTTLSSPRGGVRFLRSSKWQANSNCVMFFRRWTNKLSINNFRCLDVSAVKKRNPNPPTTTTKTQWVGGAEQPNRSF